MMTCLRIYIRTIKMIYNSMNTHILIMYYIVFSHYDTVASSVLNTISFILNPNATMEFHDIVVTCDINPTSTVEYCQVLARNNDPCVTDRMGMFSTSTLFVYHVRTYVQ